MFYKKEQLIRRLWEIEGHPDYFVGNDNKIYTINKTGNLVESKLYIKGYTKGVFLKGRFFSLIKLRQMLRKTTL